MVSTGCVCQETRSITTTGCLAASVTVTQSSAFLAATGRSNEAVERAMGPDAIESEAVAAIGADAAWLHPIMTGTAPRPDDRSLHGHGRVSFLSLAPHFRQSPRWHETRVL